MGFSRSELRGGVTEEIVEAESTRNEKKSNWTVNTLSEVKQWKEGEESQVSEKPEKRMGKDEKQASRTIQATLK